MKNNNRLQTIACGVAILAFASCTDVWEDHYQPSPSLNAEESLWELIVKEPDLQEFEELLIATQYDSLLMQNRSYTVWAPADGSGYYDKALLENASDSILEVLRKEVVENHIANYSHVGGGIRDKEDKENYKKVSMLNGKTYNFEGSPSGGYTFSNSKLSKANIVAKNGVLHKLGGSVDFAANIWEQLPKLSAVSSLWKFLEKDYHKTFDPYNSVKGPIVEGQETFLDSAWTIDCRWFREIGWLDREDSSYTVLALHDDAWEEMFAATRSYYIYNSGLEDQYTKKTSEEISDSIVKELMCRNLVFSNTVNKKFFEGQRDSLISTTGQIFKGKEAAALYYGGWESYELSNGKLFVVDKLQPAVDGEAVRIFDPLTCWHDTIRIQAEALSADERYPDQNSDNDNDGKGFTDATKEYKLIPDTLPAHKQVAGKAVCCFTAKEGTNVNPNFNFFIDNVLSAKYRIKLVLLPPQEIDPSDNYFVKPNKFTARIYYDNGSGVQTSKALKTKEGESTFYSNAEAIDTIVFFYEPEEGASLTDGIDIPVCEANLNRINEAAKVQTRLHIESTIKFANRGGDNSGAERNPNKWKYDNSFRIDEVIFEPLPADYVYDENKE